MAVLVLIIDSFIPFAKQGKSENEVKQAIELHDLKQDNALKQKKINQYESKLNTFIHEKSKIDSITDGYNEPQIDSFYTEFFKR